MKQCRQLQQLTLPSMTVGIAPKIPQRASNAWHNCRLLLGKLSVVLGAVALVGQRRHLNGVFASIQFQIVGRAALALMVAVETLK